MSVFTMVTEAELSRWLEDYAIGSLVALKGIAAGIENTNYFVTTTRGRFVLTLFEKLTEAELPFYLNLMAHLAKHGIPCPAPIASKSDALLSRLNGKPATLVSCLPGATVLAPAAQHCAVIGSVLADMHLAGRTYEGRLENPRGRAWWHETAPKVTPFLSPALQALLDSELAYQASLDTAGLPRGPIHADLFRDNALWDSEGAPAAPRLGGVIDFYFAGIDCWLFDVAVTVNDWCVHADGEIVAARAEALLGAYAGRRAFSAAERQAWPAMMRAAALRFWLSRLHDFYLPRPGELTHAHDPEHFRRVLECRRRACIALG
ncbi:MAG: homoserine kinase [Burkholderiales bacterium]|nr:homoserine kinase [Burkholderiales bacterium]